MKKLLLAFVFVLVGLLMGCAMLVPMGGLYTGVKLPFAATGNSGASSKTGVAECKSVLGLVAVTSALFMIHWGWSPLVAVPLCLLVGLACGVTSGTLISRFRVQPFIATLAMMVFARGVAKYISGGRKISQGVETADGFVYLDFPGFFNFLNARILGDNVAVVTLVFLACAVGAGLLLARFRPGRYMYAVGGNEEAARLSGVAVAFTCLLYTSPSPRDS